MKITIQQLKNTMKVAQHTGKTEQFSAKISNDKRDISIVVKYSQAKDVKQDIYPFWLIVMVEEELTDKAFLGGNELTHVRDIYNTFITQGNSSFLETWSKEKQFAY